MGIKKISRTIFNQSNLYIKNFNNFTIFRLYLKAVIVSISAKQAINLFLKYYFTNEIRATLIQLFFYYVIFLIQNLNPINIIIMIIFIFDFMYLLSKITFCCSLTGANLLTFTIFMTCLSFL